MGGHDATSAIRGTGPTFILDGKTFPTADKSGVSKLTFSPDGRHVAYIENDGSCQVVLDQVKQAGYSPSAENGGMAFLMSSAQTAHIWPIFVFHSQP